MLFVQIFSIIAQITTLILGLIVLFKNKKNLANQLFYYLSLAVLLWIFCNYMIDFTNAKNSVFSARVWLDLVVIGPVFIPFLLVYLAYIFPRKTFNLPNYFWIIQAIILIFFVALSPSKLNVEYLAPPDTIKFGIYYDLYLIYALIFISLALYWIYNKIKKLVGIEKYQSLYFFMGIIGTLVLLVLTNVVAAMMGYLKISSIGPIFSLFMVVCISYSILVHHLFDIRVIIKKTLVYSSLLLFVLVTYTLVVVSMMALLGANVELGWTTIISNMFAALLIAIGFKPLEEWLSESTDRWLFKGEYKSQDVLSKLSESLATVIDLNEALVSMMKTVADAMRVQNAATFVLRKKAVVTKTGEELLGKGELEVARTRAIGYDMEEKRLGDSVHPVIHYFEKNATAKILVTEDLLANEKNPDFKESEVLLHLKELKVAIAMPIRTKDKLIGIFIFGEKLSGDLLTQKDTDLLEIAVKQTAAAIEKARFYEEDQLKSEFVSIASHELLTPTSAIEGYLSMILDEHLAKVDKKAEGYLQKVYTSSKRLATLVKELLNVSRIEGGRVVIQWQAFDIIKLINDVIDEIQPKVKEKNLKLIYYPPKAKEIKVFADDERAHQILVNLIGNALKYTQEGSVMIACSQTPGFVEIAITDTGIGMSEEDQKHLFEKFFRASNANKFGAGGTGLGLYISKNLAELMGGRIRLKSAIGKGSTFYFDLKIATPDQIKNMSQKPVGTGIIPYKKQ